jgi:hypothetical protein
MSEETSAENTIQTALDEFYRRRLEKAADLDLNKVLEKKNPYLFRAIGIAKAQDLVELIITSYIWSSDETIFGDSFFEMIAKSVSGGVTSSNKGIDIIIEKPDRYIAIAVKSGPNAFNSSQSEKQHQEFMKARNIAQKTKKQFDALLAAGYGNKRRDPTSESIYRIRCGQEFWEELTGDEDFYLLLHKGMGEKPISHKRDHDALFAKLVNRFTKQFLDEFSLDGEIDWDKLVKFNSGKKLKQETTGTKTKSVARVAQKSKRVAKVAPKTKRIAKVAKKTIK